MKQIIKRITAGFMAFLTMIMTLISSAANVSAASPSSNLKVWYASVRNTGEISEFKPGYSHGKVLYTMIDGNAAYCLNFAKSADGGQAMASSQTSSTADAAQEKLLSYAMYYGYGCNSESEPGAEQKGQFIATQAMVWIIMNNLFNTGSADSAAAKMCQSAPNPDASFAYYVALRDNIARSYYAAVPSFASSRISAAPVYELHWNAANNRFEAVLDDVNGVLGSFDVSAAGYGFEKYGNSLLVYCYGVDTAGVTAAMNSNAGAVETKSNCVYWQINKEGYQEFISERPTADPLYGYFHIKTENIGYGDLTKTDESTGAGLPGAVYGIYSDSGCTSLLQTMTTDGNGYAKSGQLTAGTYYVKEMTAPHGYVLSGQVHTLVVYAGQTTRISASDKEQMGSLTVYKEGEVLTGWNGSRFIYEKRRLAGAEFTVSAGEDIYRADGARVYKKGDVVKAGLKTGKDGQAVLTDLHLGIYTVRETKSIDGYTINTTPKTVKIEYQNQNITVQEESATVENSRQKAEVTVEKKDSVTNNPLKGGEYTLFAGNDIKNIDGAVILKKGSAIQKVATGPDGRALYTVDLPIKNSFYIAETKAPDQYVRNSEDVYHFDFSVMPQEQAVGRFTHTFLNDRTTARIQLQKVDKETGKAVPQGDASLEGAVYGLYAREDILHPDCATGVMYHAGDLVTELVTDKNGFCSIDNLYLGKYYAKEIKPPEGYLLDDTEHDINCNYEGDLIPQVLRSGVSKEQVIKQPFQIIKVSDDGKQTEAALLKGAGFSVYLKSSLKVKKDGSYDFESAEPVVIGENGETIMYTDSKGYACTIPIPYGTYVVVEKVTPHNLEPVKPFLVKITENRPEEPQVWRVFIDREFKAKLCIIKKDADTKKTVLVSNAEFKIYDLDKNEYVSMITTYPSKVTRTSFFTDEDGDLILPERLGIGNYRIEEVSAPYGYVVSDRHITVAVDQDTFYEMDPDTEEAIITVEYENQPAIGELAIEKRGEVLDGYVLSLNEDGEFEYKEAGLEGAVYEVYAAEDIYTADNQTDGSGSRTKYYSAGELVSTLTTNKDGKAALKNLPLGTYKVVEVKAPYGYVLNTEEQFVTFAYVDGHTPVIYEKLVFENDRQKLSLSVTKLDSETKEAVSGAAFAVFADEDIKNADGRVIVKAGTLLETAVSDDNGLVSFKKDYPFADYYAREVKAPAGYVSNTEVIRFEAKYQGQDIPVAEYQSEFLNTPTTFEFTKEDITSGVELSGAALTVMDSDGNVVESWKSVAGEKHVIKKLHVGETYILREEFAPYGYLRAADVEFTVMDTEEIQSVAMRDEVPTGTIIINKDGEFINKATITKGHWYQYLLDYKKRNLEGVEFKVYAAEEIMSPDGLDTVYFAKDELVATMVTDKAGTAVLDKLPLGKYYLVETKTAEGFVIDKTPIEADLSYVDQDTAVVYAGDSITNERQKVKISVEKKDSETQEPLKGAVFGLFVKEDIFNADGETVLKAGEEVERGETDENGRLVFTSDLPLGQYYVKEEQAPKGYVKSEEVFDVDASYQGDDVEVVEVTAEFDNTPIKVSISKTDITGEKELAGATLTIMDSEGNVVETWVSTNETHIIERLPVGKYTLREETAPYGYKIANDVEFEVTEKSEIQKVSMKDESAVGKIVIDKTDEKTGNPIAGVTFEIRDASGSVVEVLVTDENGHAESGELPICIYDAFGNYVSDIHYFVVETKAADGYYADVTMHDIVLSYEGNAPDCIAYALAVTNKPVTPPAPKTGDTKKPFLWAGIGVLSLAAAGIAFKKKKKQ